MQPCGGPGTATERTLRDLPSKRYLDWTLDDPVGKGIDAVRPIRDEIEKGVRTLIGELLPEGGA